MANFALRAKVLLIIVNTFLWLSGCGFMAVGIWLKADQGMVNLSAALSSSTITNGQNVVEIMAWICIGTGVFIFVVGACGLLAVLRESKLMLMVYVFCLVLVLAGEISAAIYAVVKKDQVINSLRESGREYMATSYNFSDTSSKGFNYVMLKFECCGVNNYTDFYESSYVNRSRRWNTYGAAITSACCSIHPADLSNTTVDGPEPINQTACYIEASLFAENSSTPLNYFYPQGCLTSFVDFISKNLVVVVAVGFSITVVEILAIVFASLLYCNIDEEKIYIKG